MKGIGCRLAILRVLRTAEKPLRVHEIAKRSGWNIQACCTALGRLNAEKLRGFERSGEPGHGGNRKSAGYSYQIKQYARPSHEAIQRIDWPEPSWVDK